MSKYRPIFAVIRLVVACLILSACLRTWLVMGLVEPVTVAGSSMVPTLHGLHVSPRCPQCGHWFRVGAEFALSKPAVPCPQCTKSDVPLGGLPLQRADRLWIDRTSLPWRQLKRWDLIVTHNPHNGEELCVKRIVGLPGERITLHDGDVLVDGAILVKTLGEQRIMRRKIYREQASSQRWQTGQGSGWGISGSSWRHVATNADTQHWLHYQHPQPITDDVTYNVGLTRQLHLVDEFMLSVEMGLQGTGVFSMAIDDGTIAARLDLDLPTGELLVSINQQAPGKVQISAVALECLTQGNVRFELSNFDGQLLLAIDGHVECREPWPQDQAAGKAAGTAQPFSLGATGLEIRLHQLTVYRDTYHTNRVVGVTPLRVSAWQLSKGEYFLLGDNSPVSLDSRLWGPVPGRLFLGKPLLSGR